MELGIIRNGDWKHRYIATSFEDAIEHCIGYNAVGDGLGDMSSLEFYDEFNGKDLDREEVISDIKRYFECRRELEMLNTKDYA